MKTKKRKRNPPGAALVLGALLAGITLAALATRQTVKKKKKSSQDDSSGGDGDADGGTDGTDGKLPDYEPVPGKKYKKGPRGKGRVYGQPNIALPDALFTSNKVIVGPNCEWVVEGEQFMPPIDSPSYQGNEIEADTLFDTLQMGGGEVVNEVLPQGVGANHAYGYAAWLANSAPGEISASKIAQALFEEGASLWKKTVDRGKTSPFPTQGFLCAGTADNRLPQPLKDWREDMRTRALKWLNENFQGIPFGS